MIPQRSNLFHRRGEGGVGVAVAVLFVVGAMLASPWLAAIFGTAIAAYAAVAISDRVRRARQSVPQEQDNAAGEADCITCSA